MEKECCECGNNFVVRKKDESILLFKEPDDYICLNCYEERINSEYRILNGSYLCSNSKCARNKIAFSNFCEICDREFI
jgi:hypothetical protein